MIAALAVDGLIVAILLAGWTGQLLHRRYAPPPGTRRLARRHHNWSARAWHEFDHAERIRTARRWPR